MRIIDFVPAERNRWYWSFAVQVVSAALLIMIALELLILVVAPSMFRK